MAVKVYVVFYAIDRNIEKLAKEVGKGANSEAGVEAKLWQVPETLSIEELANLGEPAKNFKSDVPIITPDELSKADGFFFGFPLIFGKMASQFKAFIDATGDLGKAEQLAGKPAAIFITNCSQVDKETIPTAITQLHSHRLVYASTEFAYSYCTDKTKNTKVEVEGKGTYGAGIYTGSLRDTSDLEDAFQRGKLLAVFAKRIASQ